MRKAALPLGGICVYIHMFWAAPHGLWDLSSLTKDQIWAQGSESTVLTVGPPGNSCVGYIL